MEQTLEEKVESALNQIRPFLHKDGGDVKVLKITKDKNSFFNLLVHVKAAK